MKDRKRKSESLLKVAIHYQDKPIALKEVLLCFCSFLCSFLNVLSPLRQKWILENLLDKAAKQYALLFILITVFSYILLGICNVLNLQIFYRFRLIRENERILSLSEKDPEIIRKEGAGAYSASVFGDSDQISKVIAANWFLILFNRLSAIASRVISAVYSLYFLLIALCGYVLILIGIVLFTHFSILFYRKGKEDGYTLSPKVRELVDDRNTILSYTTRSAYQNRVKEFFLRRDGHQRKSEEIDRIEDAAIKGIEALCVAVLLYFGIRQRNPSSALYDPKFDYPTLVALISYFTTIFLPIPSLSSTFKNRRMFSAFYSRIKDVVSYEPIGKIPLSRELSFDRVSIDEHPRDRDIPPLRRNFSSIRKGKVGLYREDPVLRQKFRQRRDGDIRLSGGRILLGGHDLKNIRKTLVRALIRFPSTANDIFFDGAAFNLTLGKPLLSDEEYEAKREEYQEGRNKFLLRIKDGSIYSFKQRALLSLYLKDILGMDYDAIKNKEEKDALTKAFSLLSDLASYVRQRAPCFFSREYAKKSRYESLIKDLGREELFGKSFGPRGKNLTREEKKKIILARYLLLENGATLRITDNRVLSDREKFRNLMASYTDSKNVVLLSSDRDLLKKRTDRIIFFDSTERKGTWVEKSSKKK